MVDSASPPWSTRGLASPKKFPAIVGASYGLGAAALFGLSVPVGKVLLEQVQPFVLAGLLYFGSGVGLVLCRFTNLYIRRSRSLSASEAPIRRADLPWLAAAVLIGGTLGGIFMMVGLAKSPATQASLLLNLEAVFGALVAWLVYRENANRRVVFGMILLTVGAMSLSAGGAVSDGGTGAIRSDSLSDLLLQVSPISVGSMCIVAACLCWAIDNNLTRKISASDPLQIASIKGFVAGTTSVCIGLSMGAAMPPPLVTLAALVVGFLSYGISLVLYILGLRHTGAARTAAYFSAAPFIGAVCSVLFLHEPVRANLVIAALLMAAGLWLHLSEQHEHEHVHEELEHEHAHVHDEHHQHEHATDDPLGEPHSHRHRHERLIHTHPHMPDIHHLHEH